MRRGGKQRARPWLKLPTEAPTADELDGYAALVKSATTGLSEAERARLRGLEAKPARASPVQWEDAEMERLAVGVYQRWWWPGYVRWEARSHDARRLERLARQGHGAGWPDCGLFVPAVLGVGGAHAVAAVVEVKRESLRPKRDPGPRWWLEDWGPGSRYGVTAEQGRRLRELAGCGLATLVAHGADEAFDWLDQQAGPRPAVLPDGWDEPAGPDDWA